MDDLSKDVEQLNHLDGFLRLSRYIEEQRERCIKDLKGADDGTIREISGKIQAYDDYLELVQWQFVRSRALSL